MTAGGLVRVVVPKLLRRDDPAGAGGRALIGAGLVLLAAGALPIALGVRWPGLLALVWIAGLLLGIGLLAIRLRAMLAVAVVGLALGVGSLFVVLGVASGIEQALISSMARFNGHALIGKYGLDFSEYEQVAAKLEADPRVRVASPFVFGVGAVVAIEGEVAGSEPDPDADERGEPVVVTIKGLDPRRASQMTGLREVFASAGGIEDALRAAGPRELPGIVIGARLARRLDVEIGERVRLVVPASIQVDSIVTEQPPRHAELEVRGVIESGFAEFDASVVFVHLTAAQALVYAQRRVTGIEIELARARLGEAMPVAEELAEALDAPRRAKGYPPVYRAETWIERSSNLEVVRQAKLITVIVLGMIVVVASSSLVAALLLLIRSKRAHIGVLAALGARPRQVFWLFETVGLVAGLLGAGFGLLLGALTLLGLGKIRLDLDPDLFLVDHLPVAFVLGDMLIPSVLAVVVCGLVSGPIALQASRMRPLGNL